MANATVVTDDDIVATLNEQIVASTRYDSGSKAAQAFTLRNALAKKFGLSENKASTVCRDAANRGVIVKLGQGSATKYTTPKIRQAQIVSYRETHQRLGTVLQRLEEIGAKPEPYVRWIRPEDTVEQFRRSADVSWQLIEQLLTLIPEGATLTQ